jgi:hypothetical protein
LDDGVKIFVKNRNGWPTNNGRGWIASASGGASKGTPREAFHDIMTTEEGKNG